MWSGAATGGRGQGCGRQGCGWQAGEHLLLLLFLARFLFTFSLDSVYLRICITCECKCGCVCVCECVWVCAFMWVYGECLSVCGGVNWKTMTTRQAPPCSNWNLATQIPRWMAKCNWNNFTQRGWGKGSGVESVGGVNIHHRYAANTWTHTPAQLPVCVCVSVLWFDIKRLCWPCTHPLPSSLTSPPLCYIPVHVLLFVLINCVYLWLSHTHTHTHTRNWYLPKHNNKINHNLSAPLAGVIYALLNLPYIHKLLFWLSFICSYIFFIYFF